MDQVIQVIGALMILVAFAGVQFGRLDPANRWYLWLNFVGSAILAVLAAIGVQIGFILLEGIWALVSGWSLIQLARGRTPSGAH